MRFTRVVLSFAVLVAPLAAENYPLILRGKVTMADGTPPPKSVGIQRVCSDGQGSAPGPLTDKKGEYIWRMEVDPLRTRVCYLETSMAGYQSTRIDISALNGYNNTSVTLDTMVLAPTVLDPYTINTAAKDLSSKANSAWKAAIKAMDAGNLQEVRAQMEETVKAAPKFAGGWHALGVVYEQVNMPAEARAAFEKAIEADPKLLAPYMTLARACIRTKDYACAAKASDGMIKADLKKTYPAIYLHQAVAKYGLKDLEGAEAAAREAIKQDAGKKSRAEYVLGRILEAKGDLAGAREHMNAYLKVQPDVGDAGVIKAHVEALGKPEAASIEPELELL